jgi:hypothetical protein
MLTLSPKNMIQNHPSLTLKLFVFVFVRIKFKEHGGLLHCRGFLDQHVHKKKDNPRDKPTQTLFQWAQSLPSKAFRN